MWGRKGVNWKTKFLSLLSVALLHCLTLFLSLAKCFPQARTRTWFLVYCKVGRRWNWNLRAEQNKLTNKNKPELLFSASFIDLTPHFSSSFLKGYKIF